MWEDTYVSFGKAGFQRAARWDNERFRMSFVRLAAHYWSHDGFCDPPLLGQMDRLATIPCTMIHGRRDISSPAVTAWELHQRWPGSQLVVDDQDGHGGPSMLERWRSANDSMVNLHNR